MRRGVVNHNLEDHNESMKNKVDPSTIRNVLFRLYTYAQKLFCS